jgi:glycosyltransferase involved in cell wall biosynthesis
VPLAGEIGFLYLSVMKKRVAVLRGPNLNSWEMQNFSPLSDEFDVVAFASHGHHFPLDGINLPVRKLFSIGQALHFRTLRQPFTFAAGDYHDLLGLAAALQGFDIVHAAETGYRFTAQAARAKRRNPFRLVVTVWENIPFAIHSRTTRANKQAVNDATDLFLPVSERSREVLLLEGASEDRIRILMPGIDLNHFRPMPKDERLLARFGCSPGDTVILFVANLYREKGIFDLLFAFSRVHTRLGQPPGLRLLVAGRGRDGDAARALTHELGLDRQVSFIGSHPYDRMPAIHNCADMFVLPSLPTPLWQEQFGYVLIESMACGKPLISTHTGSIPEVVGETGILVPPNDFTALSRAVEDLVTNPTKRGMLGSRSRSRAEELFDVRASSSHLRHYYQELS